MRRGAPIFPLLLGLALLPATLAAEAEAEPAKPPKTRMQNQLHQLIRADAGLAAGPAAPVFAPGPAAVTGETLELEPMVIREPKLMEPPPRESGPERFFRTGTLWEKVGRRFTRRLWVDGGRGIGFTLSW